MAIALYTTDLVPIATADEATGWVELTGTDGDGYAYSAQNSPAYTDASNPFIQGSYAVTQATPVGNAMASLGYNSGGITVPLDGAIFLWQNFNAPLSMGTYAQGGQRIAAGSGLNDFKVWKVGGNDKDNNPYGGFVNHVINPTVAADKTAGTPTGVLNYVAAAAYVVTGTASGQTHQCDIIRYGRGASIFEFGDGTLGYATIDGYATKNDLQANRWGLIQKLFGGYLFKGKMQLGSLTNAVYFNDADRIILVQWTPKVTQKFNTVEILNAASTVSMTRLQFVTLDPSTASRGNWVNTANALLTLTSCTFSDLYTFVFGSNSTLTSCIFNRCNQITQASAVITGCTFNKSDSASTIISNTVSLITNCNFTSGGSNHAVQATTAGNYDWNNTCIGYATADGATGNEVFYNNSGGLINLTVQGGTPPSVRNGAGATTVIKQGNPAVINLGTAANFGLLCQGAITGNGSVQGDIGSGAGGIAPTISATGTKHPTGDAATMTAIADFDAAYKEGFERPPSVVLSAAAYDIGGLVLKRGTYKVGAACTLTSPVYFDAENDPKAVFIMQIGAAFGATAATGNIKLLNGAQAKNIFWIIAGAVSMGANTDMIGTVLGASTVTFGATTTVLGRVLNCKTGSTITLATTSVTSPDPGVTLSIIANVSLVGAEIRIYDLNATYPFFGTELSGTEYCATATYDYVGGAGSQGNVIWIQIMKPGYVEFGQQITMPQLSGNFLPILSIDKNG